MDEAKERAREIWSAGDYAPTSRQLEQASIELVDHLGIGPGDSVLDIAAGDGNLAVAAARAGAHVTATDFSDVMVNEGRKRTEDANLAVEWKIADAEDLLFEDDTFDFVTSVFGVMFAAEQQKAATEMLRTARPGGTVALAAWTPEGQSGDFFEALETFGPPAEPDRPDPLLWGTDNGIRSLFPHAAEIRFRRLNVTFSYPSWDAMLGTIEAHGAFVLLKQRMSQERYEALQAAMEDVIRKYNRGTNGAVVYDSEYLETLIRK